jgi:hypothetical protein
MAVLANGVANEHFARERGFLDFLEHFLWKKGQNVSQE